MTAMPAAAGLAAFAVVCGMFGVLIGLAAFEAGPYVVRAFWRWRAAHWRFVEARRRAGLGEHWQPADLRVTINADTGEALAALNATVDRVVVWKDTGEQDGTAEVVYDSGVADAEALRRAGENLYRGDVPR